jgi:hypothetical protein
LRSRLTILLALSLLEIDRSRLAAMLARSGNAQSCIEAHAVTVEAVADIRRGGEPLKRSKTT